MQQPNDEKRKKIVHDFAQWTALSALRSGSPLKSGQQIYSLIDRHARLTVLFDATRAIDQNEFDRWHEQTVAAFVDAEPALRRTSQVGWAAKIINVYLKTRVYRAREGRDGLMSVIHPHIDSGLLKGLRKRFLLPPWKIKSIKGIQSYQDDYFPFIEECRSLA